MIMTREKWRGMYGILVDTMLGASPTTDLFRCTKQ